MRPERVPAPVPQLPACATTYTRSARRGARGGDAPSRSSSSRRTTTHSCDRPPGLPQLRKTIGRQRAHDFPACMRGYACSCARAMHSIDRLSIPFAPSGANPILLGPPLRTCLCVCVALRCWRLRCPRCLQPVDGLIELALGRPQRAEVEQRARFAAPGKPPPAHSRTAPPHPQRTRTPIRLHACAARPIEPACARRARTSAPNTHARGAKG